MNWKDFFHLSKRERRGLLLLFVLLAGIALGKWLFTSEPQTIIEYVPVQEPHASASAYSTPERKTINKPEPKTSRPTKGATLPPPEERTYYPQEKKDSVYTPRQTFPKVEKFPEGTVIDLNSADTTSLKKIPGIGSSYAKRIVAYRNLLGGYYRHEQLQEVYGMYEELYEMIIPYLSVHPDSVKKIEVNRSSLERLRSHPYINFYQAKAITDLRKKKEHLKSMDELSLLEEFPEEEREKIAPYLSFE